MVEEDWLKGILSVSKKFCWQVDSSSSLDLKGFHCESIARKNSYLFSFPSELKAAYADQSISNDYVVGRSWI